MADAGDPQQLLTALTTEHFTLQGARSQAMSESASRTTLYIGAVSSALVALGFTAQISEVGDAFDVFALTVLPTLYVLGAFTFIRLVECGAEDFRYGLAINRIRGYYQQLAGDQAGLFLLSGHDDGRGVFENMGLPGEGRSQLFSFATVVAIINSVVGGSAAAIAADVLGAPLGAAAAIGGGVAIVSVVAWVRRGGAPADPAHRRDRADVRAHWGLTGAAHATARVHDARACGSYPSTARSRFSGMNLLAVNVAPWGSLMTVMRTHGASNGATSTRPPSSIARTAVASASATPSVMLQCGAVSVSPSAIGMRLATTSSKRSGAPPRPSPRASRAGAARGSRRRGQAHIPPVPVMPISSQSNTAP